MSVSVVNERAYLRGLTGIRPLHRVSGYGQDAGLLTACHHAIKRGSSCPRRKVGVLINKHVSAPMLILIKKLNETLRGWANYHRHLVSSEAFSCIDKYVFERLWRMVRKRHPNKSRKWPYRKYWKAAGRKHIFSVIEKTQKGIKKMYRVIRTSSIGIKRHIKIKAAANPYDPEYTAYFWQRRNKRGSKLLPALSARAFRAQFA